MSEQRRKDQAGVLFKCSHENRERLKQKAADAGFDAVQTWMEFVLLDIVDATRRPTRAKAPQLELPLTG